MTTWRNYSLQTANDLVTEGVGTFPVHPAADLLPDMSATELERLTADMKANGYNGQPIVIRNSSSDHASFGPPFLLEGRHRLKAALAAGLKIVPVEWLEEKFPEPYVTVTRLNIHRRHLTAEQRADLAVKLLSEAGRLAEVEAEANERQQSWRPSTPKGGKVQTSPAEEVAKVEQVGRRKAEGDVARHGKANGKAPRKPAKRAPEGPTAEEVLKRWCETEISD